jgi:hypothetical protein
LVGWLYSYSVLAATTAAMPGKQVLADSRSIHPVNTPLRLIVETRPAVPKFPAVSTPILCFTMYMSSVGESHVLSVLFRSANFPTCFLENFSASYPRVVALSVPSGTICCNRDTCSLPPAIGFVCLLISLEPPGFLCVLLCSVCFCCCCLRPGSYVAMSLYCEVSRWRH